MKERKTSTFMLLLLSITPDSEIGAGCYLIGGPTAGGVKG
jgi:hypothetical protein